MRMRTSNTDELRNEMDEAHLRYMIPRGFRWTSSRGGARTPSVKASEAVTRCGYTGDCPSVETLPNQEQVELGGYKGMYYPRRYNRARTSSELVNSNSDYVRSKFEVHEYLAKQAENMPIGSGRGSRSINMGYGPIVPIDTRQERFVSE